jgi:predicted porin
MKKILLGTTTLIGAASLMAGAAHADTPKVTLGGYSDFQVGVVSEDFDTAERSSAFRSDNVLTFRVDGKSDAGLGYGAFIELHADVSQDSQDAKDSGGSARRTYMYLDGNWGRLQYGSDFGVTKTMKIDASSIARASGGIDGDFKLFQIVDTSSPVQVIGTPDLLLDYGSGQLGNRSTENINKVSYYSPAFAGFSAGASFLFDTEGTSRGQTLNRSDDDSSQAENVWLGALRYAGEFSGFKVAAAATGEWGNAEVAGVQDLRTWNVGAQVGYMGFSVAGSYGTWGDSLRSSSALDDSDYWTLGAAYETGPFGVSVTWMRSNYEATTTTDNEFDNLSVGVDYKLAPGLTPYAEVSFFDIDGPTNATDDNNGTVFIAGTQLAF